MDRQFGVFYCALIEFICNHFEQVAFTNLLLAGRPKVMDKTALTKKTILVVEDEPLSRLIISKTLINHGFNCVEAEHGHDALDKLMHLEECHLILTDLRMPICNGLELIEYIRNGESPNTDPNVDIVVLSAEEGKMVDKAKDLGISGHFIKKEPIDTFIPYIRKLLGLLPVD